MTTYTKKSTHEIAVVEVVPEKVIPAETLPEKIYDYGFLLKQVADIQSQWDEQLAQKQKEIVEINEQRGKEKAFVEKLITEAKKLGIEEEPIKVIIEEDGK